MKDTNNQGKSFQERLAEAEERRKNETISDIIAAKRREADSIEASARGSFKAGEDWDEMPFTESDLESALDLAETKRKEADRLEAALKRELSKNTSKNGADFGQLGDCAKLREACEDVLEEIDKWRTDGSMEHWQYSQLFDIADDALAAPMRNCDKYATAEEARQAWLDDAGNWDEFGSPRLELHEWLFAPVTE